MLTLANNQEYFKQKRFVVYLTAGLGDTTALAKAMVEGGADILEIGVPFSDPVLDGPVIQQAMQQALSTGITLVDVIQLCQEIKSACAVPIVLFSYYNPIFRLGERFYQLAANAGIDATLIVDLPLAEQSEHLALSKKFNIANIQLIATNSPADEIQAAEQAAPLFHYYACRAGTTGMRAALPDDFADKVHFIRENVASPVVVGFGVSDQSMAAAVCQHADGFVVGSRLVKAILEGCNPAQIKEIVQAIAQ